MNKNLRIAYTENEINSNLRKGICYENSCGEVTEAAYSFSQKALRYLQRLKNPPYHHKK